MALAVLFTLFLIIALAWHVADTPRRWVFALPFYLTKTCAKWGFRESVFTVSLCWLILLSMSCSDKSPKDKTVVENKDTIAIESSLEKDKDSVENATSFIDSRDGKRYKTVKMPDGKVWMAENLNYKMGNSVCYENNEKNCEQCGRLYDWETAMKVCPVGWHLSTSQERLDLEYNIDGMKGVALKSKNGWNNGRNGTDMFGFNALPCGDGDRFTDGEFSGYGESANFWSATKCEPHCEYGEEGEGELVCDENEYIEDWSVGGGGDCCIHGGCKNKAVLRSVRCVKDTINQ